MLTQEKWKHAWKILAGLEEEGEEEGEEKENEEEDSELSLEDKQDRLLNELLVGAELRKDGEILPFDDVKKPLIQNQFTRAAILKGYMEALQKNRFRP